MNSSPDFRTRRIGYIGTRLKLSLILLTSIFSGRLLVGEILYNYVSLYYSRPLVQAYHKGDGFHGVNLLLDSSGYLTSQPKGAFDVLEEFSGVERALALNNLSLNYMEGQSALACGELNTAVNIFEGLINQDSGKGELAYFSLGLIYELKGQHSHAIHAWRQISGSSHFFLREGMNRLYSVDDPYRAIESLKLSIETDPATCEPYYRLGVAWIKAKDSEEALNTFSTLEALHCSDYFLGEMLYQRGKLLANMGYTEEAVEDLQHSLDLNSKDPKRLVALGNLLAEYDSKEARDEAYALYIEAITLAPEKTWSYISLCDLECRQKRYSEAMYWCAQAVGRSPEDEYGYYYFGIVHRDMDNLPEARSLFERAVLLNNTNINTWFRLGEVYTEMEETEQALTAYKTILQLDPENSTAQRRIDQLFDR